MLPEEACAECHAWRMSHASSAVVNRQAAPLTEACLPAFSFLPPPPPPPMSQYTAALRYYVLYVEVP